MNITGTGMVFKNEHTTNSGETWYSYAIGISSKTFDGEYVSTTMPIKFRKEVELENKSRIDIRNGFLAVREYTKDGNKRKIVEIICLEFDLITAESAPDGFTQTTDSDLPF